MAAVTFFSGDVLTAAQMNALDALAFNAQTGTTYTLVAADKYKLVTTSNGSAVTITIPTGVFAAGVGGRNVSRRSASGKCLCDEGRAHRAHRPRDGGPHGAGDAGEFAENPAGPGRG